jgi:hypothetical protein
MRRICGLQECDEPAVDFVTMHSGSCPALSETGGCNCGPLARYWLCANHYDNIETVIGMRLKPSAFD